MDDIYYIIIAGSRGFTDYKIMKHCFYNFIKNNQTRVKPTIICGMAQGADMLGYKLAKEFDLPIIEMPADWDRFGKRAGYLRNEQMAIRAERLGNGVLMAFWDGKSHGTQHMINLARKHNLEIHIYNFKGEETK